MIRIRAIFLLMLFSISTIGNAIDLHYCNGKITDLSVFGETSCCCAKIATTENSASCHTEEQSDCHHNKELKQAEDQNTIQTKGCCNSETVQMNSRNEYAQTSSIQVLNAILLIHFNPFIFDGEPVAVLDGEFYEEPLRAVDIPVLLQTFLI